ncbi:hypothetical protein AVEN_106993-1 [Araneus ventricosus]|uniref:Uncharacterized protein n=1 Tax=Araneus ventricosus TaxID=182803 RepID=A0A4Y2RA29_ARAVE|nr:hypothetical protein AVEN_106993-1 [Araneus ventricosus]
MANLPENWPDTLPLALLDIRSSFKQHLATSSAQLVYETTLKLQGELFFNTPVTTSTPSFLQMLRQYVRSFRPASTTLHGSSAAFVSDDLTTASHVFLRIAKVPGTSVCWSLQGPLKIRESFHCGD